MQGFNVPGALYQQKCSRLLQEGEMRFAGIIDKGGALVAGGFKETVVPYEKDETNLQSFFEFISKISIRHDYDESLGPINYLAARRDKVILMAFPFPVSNIVLLISAEPTVSIEGTAEKVVRIFTDSGQR